MVVAGVQVLQRDQPAKSFWQGGQLVFVEGQSAQGGQFPEARRKRVESVPLQMQYLEPLKVANFFREVLQHIRGKIKLLQ